MSESAFSPSPLWTQPETISDRLRQWSRSAPKWEPAEFCRDRIERFLARTASLQKRLSMPLVVAMLGGTGTGKSTLLNALVGEKVVLEGRERPTTAQPILVCHSGVDPRQWGIDLTDIQVVHNDSPFLEQLVLLDCPDPDTTENEEIRLSNLARLRAVLPLCDVLLVTGTQQKYRSRRVLDELAAAAPGARLIFVQTHASKDQDIREDWTKLLGSNYETGRIFLIDSVAAIKATAEKSPPEADFVELRELLGRELVEEAALKVRQENYFGLAEHVLDDCHREIEGHWTEVRKLRERISEERRRFGERLAENMREELIRDRRLWESRLVGRVASQWGYSPFSLLLRLYQGFGSVVSGVLLARGFASPSRLALWGAFEGVRSIRKWSDSKKMKQGPGASLMTGWEENRLRESALVLTGFAADARLSTESCKPDFVQEESKSAGEAFVADMAEQLETICDRLSLRNSRIWTRVAYEVLFSAMLLFLLIRPAKNFFIDTMLYHDAELYGIGFYLVSLFWLVAWGALLLGFFTFMLRRGLEREINETAAQWARLSSLDRLFETVEKETHEILRYRDELETLRQRIERIKQQAEKLDRRLGRKKSLPESDSRG